MSDTDCPFTFDDVQPYMEVIWNGKRGFVIDKGTHVSDRTSGSHILVEFLDQDVDVERRKTVRICESIVNRDLEAKDKLWVDFNHHFRPFNYSHANSLTHAQ